MLPKPRITTRIPLPAGRFQVLAAVDFDHQPQRRRPEIRDKRPEWSLPVELNATQLLTPNPLPEFELGVRHRLAQTPGALSLRVVAGFVIPKSQGVWNRYSAWIRIVPGPTKGVISLRSHPPLTPLRKRRGERDSGPQLSLA